MVDRPKESKRVKINLNLASRPFNNRVLPWVLTSVIVLVAVIGLFFVVRLTTEANAKAALIQVDISNLKQQEDALQSADAVKNTLALSKLQTLKAARVGHRKRFSWSRLLADLEASLPGNVKVSRIAVRDVMHRAIE